MKKYITLFLGLITFSSAFADLNNINNFNRKIEAIKIAEKACFAASTSEGSTQSCYSDMYISAEKLLNEFYKDRVQTLKQDIKSEKSLPLSQKVSHVILDRLNRAQESWSKSSNADCSLESAQMLNGNGEGKIYVRCLSVKTLQRVEYLVKQVRLESDWF